MDTEILNKINSTNFKLSEVCRICLKKSKNMTNIKQDNDEVINLINMLATLGNFEVEINNKLPGYLCKICVGNLHFSFNFQQIIQKSHQLITKCLSKIHREEMKLKPRKIRLKPKQRRMRLTLFSPEIVEKVIEKTIAPFTNNVTCLKCKFVCANNRSLIIHMNHRHKEFRERWCATCNQEVEDLSVHDTENHNKLLECEFCRKIFTKKNHFTDHLRSHSAERPFKCSSCDQSFICKSGLEKHLPIHLSVKPYECRECQRKFTQKIHLKLHLRNIHSIEYDNSNEMTKDLKNYCGICTKKVRSLDVHNERFHPEDIVIKSEDSLEQAVALPRPKKKVICRLCGKEFGSPSNLSTHMRAHFGNLPTYKCSYCDKTMTSKNHLADHERTHTGEKPYVCNFCGKAFAQSNVLNTHLKIHTGRTEKCDLCNKTFCRPAQVKLHMRTHTGEKPFLCSECGKCFIQKSHLTEHLKCHNKDNPFKCDYCEKAFKTQSALKTHLQIHSGYKPFQCNQCPYASRQSYRLTQHMKQHEEPCPKHEESHACGICNNSFSTLDLLKSHCSFTHGISLLQ